MQADRIILVACLCCRRRTDLRLSAESRLSRRQIGNSLVCPDCQATAVAGDVIFDFAGGRIALPLGDPGRFGLS